MASATREPASAIRTLPSPACSVACDMCASRFAAHAYSFRSFFYLTPRRAHLDLDVLILLSPWLRLLRPPVAVRAENGMALSTATRLDSFFQGAAPFLCPPRTARLMRGSPTQPYPKPILLCHPPPQPVPIPAASTRSGSDLTHGRRLAERARRRLLLQPLGVQVGNLGKACDDHLLGASFRDFVQAAQLLQVRHLETLELLTHLPQSEVIRGHQRSSEVIRGHRRSSEVIGGHRRSSRSVWPLTEPEALVTALSSVFSSSVTTWLPVALTPSPDEGGHRRSSNVIKCHRRSSVALTPSHRRPWRPQSPFC